MKRNTLLAKDFLVVPSRRDSLGSGAIHLRRRAQCEHTECADDEAMADACWEYEKSVRPEDEVRPISLCGLGRVRRRESVKPSIRGPFVQPSDEVCEWLLENLPKMVRRGQSGALHFASRSWDEPHVCFLCAESARSAGLLDGYPVMSIACAACRGRGGVARVASTREVLGTSRVRGSPMFEVEYDACLICGGTGYLEAAAPEPMIMRLRAARHPRTST